MSLFENTDNNDEYPVRLRSENKYDKHKPFKTAPEL